MARGVGGRAGASLSRANEGEVTAGQYVWRPKGSKHVARASEDCLVFGFFLKPNKFF
jgi:quercetin dioxygenase-like cupin family protein